MQSIRAPIGDDPGMAESGASQRSMPTESFLRDVSWMRSLRQRYADRSYGDCKPGSS